MCKTDYLFFIESRGPPPEICRSLEEVKEIECVKECGIVKVKL